MGESTELMVKTWGIGRAEQDQLALESHQKAAAAYASGFYKDLVRDYLGVSQDNNIRRDTIAREAGESQTGVRYLRGRHPDRGKFHADDRWCVGGAACDRGLGARAKPAGAGFLELRQPLPPSTTSTRRRACSWRRRTPCREC